MLVNKGLAQIQNCSLEKLSGMRTDSKLNFTVRIKSSCKILSLLDTFNIFSGCATP